MSIWFFSDPHLGLMRTSHTTQASRLRLREALYRQATKALSLCSTSPYCLGDLFDTESNDEAGILQGYRIAAECCRVMAGNHDLPNREGKLGSLQLLADMLPGDCDERSPIVLGSVSQPGFDFVGDCGAYVYLVPHMATQELFDISLDEVTDFVGRDETSILCLHCNYNSGLIHNDASLNLTAERAEKLLETFDYVLLGHEHMPRTLHNGRLIILGNTHPTSFSDVGDKFLWEFDGKQFIQHPIWSKADGYRELRYGDSVRMDELVQFIEVTGTVPSEQLPNIAQAITKLWKEWPNLLMVRNNVQSDSIVPEVDHAVCRSLDLPSRISAALESTDLHSIWQHYREAAQ